MVARVNENLHRLSISFFAGKELVDVLHRDVFHGGDAQLILDIPQLEKNSQGNGEPARQWCFIFCHGQFIYSKDRLV